MIYYFSEKELSAIYALAGASSLYSFDISEECRDKTELISILQEFYMRDLVENSNNAFRLKEPLQSLIRKMADAKTVLRVDMPDCEVPPRIVYSMDTGKNEIIVLEHLKESYDSSFRLKKDSDTSFIDNSVYDELLVQYPSLASFGRCEFDEKAKLDEETAGSEEQICLAVSYIKTDNAEIFEKMTLCKRGLFYGIKITGETQDDLYFSEEKLKECLFRYIRRCV